MIGKICGTGSYVPPGVIENNDLAKMVDTNDEWIRERTGIIRRHRIAQETTASMASMAAIKALEQSGRKPEEIDLILVSTISPQRVMPSAACEVQKQIGAVGATCFDLNAACSGFLFAYNTAQAFIKSGLYKNVLVAGSESLSNLVDWKDRGTCILFGDGAGAAVLTAAEGEKISMVTHSYGDQGEALTCDAGGQIRMDGREVFKFAVRQVPAAIHELLDQVGLETGQIDYFLLHQANKRIVEGVARKLGASVSQFPMNLQEYGNTSSASIPILLDEMNRKGMLKPGMKMVMAGFGAGLSCGATLVEW